MAARIRERGAERVFLGIGRKGLILHGLGKKKGGALRNQRRGGSESKVEKGRE